MRNTPPAVMAPQRRPFTLIELLVVVSIIAVLAAMLLPALGRARREATSAQCMNGLRQIVMSNTFYAEDNNDGVLYPWAVKKLGADGLADLTSRQNTNPAQIRDSGGVYYDIKKAIDGYDKSLFTYWHCPAFKSATPMNDPLNTRSPATYVNYEYYAYREAGTRMVYGNLRQNKQPDRTFMLKDAFFLDTNAGLTGFNHGDGEESTNPNNPSSTSMKGTGEGSWANYAFYDGHSERHGRSSVVDIGMLRYINYVRLLAPR